MLHGYVGVLLDIGKYSHTWGIWGWLHNSSWLVEQRSGGIFFSRKPWGEMMKPFPPKLTSINLGCA